jgi:ATPase subunit of ABC transporter with duplicated ATPase domains
LAAAFQKLLDPGMMDNVARQAERILEAARVDAYEAEGLEQEKRQVEKEIDRLMKVLARTDQAQDAASLFTRQIQRRERRLREIDSILDRPRKAQQKVARLMLPLFRD